MKHPIFLFLIFTWMALPGAGFAQNYTLTGTLDSNAIFSGYTHITTQGTTVIRPGATVYLRANDRIVFSPGFSSQEGSALSAVAGTDWADADGDLLPDSIENGSCTDMNNPDTDGDGIPDGMEDADRDGIFQSGQGETDPCSADSDGDGMDDGFEIANNLDPVVDDRAGDADNDGFGNWVEFYLGTDTNDPGSIPEKGTYYEYDDIGRIKSILRIK